MSINLLTSATSAVFTPDLRSRALPNDVFITMSERYRVLESDNDLGWVINLFTRGNISVLGFINPMNSKQGVIPWIRDARVIEWIPAIITLQNITKLIYINSLDPNNFRINLSKPPSLKTSLTSKEGRESIRITYKKDVPAEAIAATPKKNPFPECTEGLFSDDFGMQMAGKKRAPRDGLRFSPTLYMRDKLRHSYYNHNAVATWMKQAEEPVRINNLPKKIDFRRKEAPSSRNDQYEEFLSKGYRFFSKMPKKLLFILEKDLFQKVSVPVFQEFVSYVKYFRELIIKDPEMILSSFFIVCKFMCLGSYAIKNTWTEDNLSSKVRIEVDRVFEQFEKILPNKIFLEWKYLLFMETVRTMELKYFSDRELKSENLELEQPS